MVSNFCFDYAATNVYFLLPFFQMSESIEQKYFVNYMYISTIELLLGLF